MDDFDGPPTAKDLWLAGTQPASEERAPCASWYGLQTLYRHEFRIQRDLIAKGLEAYLPTLRETRQWTDRKKTVEVPAFSGYLFVRHDGSSRSRIQVLETLGAVRLLPDNHKPAEIPNTEIEFLRRALDSGVACERCPEGLTVGTRLVIKRGLLAGIEGTLARINNSFRLVLNVSSVSQAISIEVDLNDVEVVKEATLSDRMGAADMYSRYSAVGRAEPTLSYL